MKSPLRYVGGKSRAIIALDYIFNHYYNNQYTTLISPFCGGASWEFHLVDRFQEIHINDKFSPLTNFYVQCKENKDALIHELTNLIGKITKNLFSEFREKIMTEANPLRKAVMYFVINRCSFSGATLSGGFSEEASKERFTESAINNICQLNLEKYVIHCEDGCDFVSKLSSMIPNAFIYCDPPYMLSSGKNKLYGNRGDLHENFDHKRFHDVIAQIKQDWIITYNDSKEIRDMYSDFTIIPASWAYGMNASKKSSEIIILSTKLPQGGIPHISGNMYEMECMQYFTDKGLSCKRFGGSSRAPDIVVSKDNKAIIVECKSTLKGTDYKEFKLDYIDGKYSCSNKLINQYIPKDLFNNAQLPKGISSVEWNRIKKPTFSDVYVEDVKITISDIIDASYIFINNAGKYKVSEDDPLNFDLPIFNFKFKLRFYIKNHSSSKAKVCNISPVVTVRVNL